MTTTKTPTTKADNVAGALAAFHLELPKIAKDKIAKVDTQRGPGYTYSYADLADISPEVLPALARHGLTWSTWPMLLADGRFVLRYELEHAASGDRKTGEWPLPNPNSSSQVLGGAVTFARRYALCAATGIAPGGDDDDAAAQRAVERAPAARRPNHPNQERNGDDASNAPPERAANAAALALLAQTCQEAGWSHGRVGRLYAESHDGADIRSGTTRDIEQFRKSLFARPDHELRDQEPAHADE